MCVTQEIDSYYCPNCLENMVSVEAGHYLNSCKKCFECPRCFSALTFSMGILGESKEKLYFLSCGYCRWDSISLDLTGESTSNLIAKAMTFEKDDDKQKRVNSVVKRRQKEERERAKEKRQLNTAQRLRRNSLLSRNAPPPIPIPQDPTSVSILEQSLAEKENQMQRKWKGEKEKEDDVDTAEESKGDQVERSWMSKDEEELVKALEEEMDCVNVTTLEHRFLRLSVQPRSFTELYPRRKHLLTQRSKRCGVCDKVLIKPDLSPTKIDFKRQHVALSYVPRVTVASLPPLILGTEVPVLLRFLNPVHSRMQMRISEDEKAIGGAQVTLPSNPTFISPKDFDEDDEDEEFRKLKAGDDSQVIVERKSNWVLIKFPVSVALSTHVKIAFKLEVSYESTSASQHLSCPLQIDLGHAVAPPPLSRT